jgi:predicted nucleic acid-binding protein
VSAPAPEVLVDTTVWSLALRRDSPPDIREVSLLRELIERGETLWLTGSILQEVLQGFHDDRRSRRLVKLLEDFPLVELHRDDYVFAADIRNRCRSRGIQVGTIDAQIASATIQHNHVLLTTDEDFPRIATLFPLRLL